MDFWLFIQIALVAFFVLVPVTVLAFLLWIKRVIDENRDLAKKELEMWSDEEGAFGRCDVCTEPIRKGFQFCPVCHKKLGNRCPSCHRFLQIKWTKCPYCGDDYTVETVSGKTEDFSTRPTSAGRSK